MRKKILIRAPALSRSGYGEQARFALRALRGHEEQFDIHLINTNWGATGWLSTDDEERRWIDFLIGKTNQLVQQPTTGPDTFDVSLQITIPNEWNDIARTNIGYTAGIESSKITPVWVEKANSMDRIIVVSEHAKHGFDNSSYQATHKETGEVIPDFKCQTPVDVVNFPVRQAGDTHSPAHIDVSEGLDISFESKFNFLAIAQNGPRKNLYNTVKWFVDEFKDDPDVGLVLKIFSHNNSTMDRHFTYNLVTSMLNAYGEGEVKCKLYLVHGEMSDSELGALYVHPDIHCLVNLAHGEGFGLPIFEAVCAGLPVLAPEWGGQLDYLYAPTTKKKTNKTKMRPHFCRVKYELKPVQEEAHWEGVIQPDSVWCYPTVNSYRKCLRDVVQDYNKYKSLAKKLKTHILKTHTFKKQSEKFVSVITEACATTTQEIISKIPAASIVAPVSLSPPPASSNVITFE